MTEISVVGGLDLKLSKVLSTLRCSDSITMVLCQWHSPLKMNHALGQTEDASSKIPREVKLCALISPICSFHNSHTSFLAIPGPPMILSSSETYTVGPLVREVSPQTFARHLLREVFPLKWLRHHSSLLSYFIFYFSFVSLFIEYQLH